MRAAKPASGKEAFQVRQALVEDLVPGSTKIAMIDNHAVVVYEMTISHTEFFRTLPAAMGTIPFSVAGNEISADWSGGHLQISLSEEGRRNFGPIPLPVTHVEMRFDGFGERERLAFLQRFDAYFRRGGG